MRATTSAPSLLSNYLNQKSDDDDGGEDAEKVLIWRRRKNLLQTMDVFNVGVCGVVSFSSLRPLIQKANQDDTFRQVEKKGQPIHHIF